MDIGGVQTQLAALGVTLTDEEDPAALVAQLQSDREYRASLTLQYLDAAHTFLTTTLAGPLPNGLGADYPFVAQALAATGLLSSLARSLDEWLCPAVEHAMDAAMGAPGPPPPPTTYTGWFDDAVFDPVLANYNANVTAFFNAYPITQNALNQIAANFQHNIETACRRIVADKAAITALFSDRYWGLTLTALTNITSTGSDFHKGGQQVLILTFATRSFGGYWPIADELKLIYKPADLELDCLIAGESAAVNRAVAPNPPFMANSLVEIFNATASANPAAGLEQLPTYRILPRNPTSGLPPPAPMAPLPIRNAYGYIEYLGYSLTGMTFNVANYYPMGASDYLIFQSQTEGPIIEKFYHQIGQWLALAVTFSVQDLHVENVRASKYQANLIDLEYSLTSPVINITQTLLFLTLLGVATGGINGASRANEAYVWTFTLGQAGGRPQYTLTKHYLTKWYQNRLWAMKPNRRLVRVNAFWLLQGLLNGMNVLRQAEIANAFVPWFNRLANVLVRVIPVSTSEWIRVRSAVYHNEVSNGVPPVQLAAALARQLLNYGTIEFDNYQNAPTPDPDFIGFFAPQASTDLQNFDIPVFYHRIGSLDMLDSMGNVVAIPPQVTVWDQNVPPNQVLSNTNVGRATFFAAAPTTPVIQNGQVANLAGGGFAATCAQWQTQVLQEMGLAVPPANPGILLH